MNITKSVDWSYPTSPNADRFKFKEGCWTVNVREGLNSFPRAVSGHASWLEAMEVADKTAGDWDRLMQLKVNDFESSKTLSPGAVVVAG